MVATQCFPEELRAGVCRDRARRRICRYESSLAIAIDRLDAACKDDAWNLRSHGGLEHGPGRLDVARHETTSEVGLRWLSSEVHNGSHALAGTFDQIDIADIAADDLVVLQRLSRLEIESPQLKDQPQGW